MALRIPKNKIQEGKYTAGNEYIIESTNTIYQGYYYEVNSTFYAGKSFDINAPKLIPIKDRNTLLNRGLSLALFSTISKITSQTLQQPKITSLPVSPYSAPGDITPKFYCSKINQQPIIIKEIDETTYNSLKSNPLYKVTYTGKYNNTIQSVLDADKELPGLKSFVG